MAVPAERRGQKLPRIAGITVAIASTAIGSMKIHKQPETFYKGSAPKVTARELGSFAVDNVNMHWIIGGLSGTNTAQYKETHFSIHNKHHHHLTAVQTAVDSITPVEFREWTVVHHCEEPSWHVNGSVYGGGLGISRVNWEIEDGLKLFGDEAKATPKEQMYIADKIQENPPDQHHCQKGGW